MTDEERERYGMVPASRLRAAAETLDALLAALEGLVGQVRAYRETVDGLLDRLGVPKDLGGEGGREAA